MYLYTLWLFVHYSVPNGPPNNVTVQTASSTSIIVYWNPPLDQERNGIITSYIIILSVDNTTREFATVNTSLTVTGLLPFTIYTFTVAASTDIGLGPASPVVIETTSEDGMSLKINDHT